MEQIFDYGLGMRSGKFRNQVLARILIGIVTFLNLQSAAVLLIWPARFTTAFELQGTAGAIMVRSIGLLFLMWNIPYLFAFTNPLKHRVSLYEAIIMQAIGLTGESLMLIYLPEIHTNLAETAVRFIWFDGFGLMGLLFALFLTQKKQLKVEQN
jgi:hypothetical protein